MMLYKKVFFIILGGVVGDVLGVLVEFKKCDLFWIIIMIGYGIYN